jgi:hypothetical protein
MGIVDWLQNWATDIRATYRDEVGRGGVVAGR